ncbi:tRNA1(Val) (adenine(37)-N6)-methyltransferase [Campylobacter vulpis]|uniref:tRNA1(Val) (adenine(37)-N6)-methyltransferase n=1 Tax=Campylobacter vulpis TaxID=1655500 RepID=UPI000C15D74C|nr:methyltransferase [Campylobacter vulpis]MBS4275180.1 methyltransferase [Campylobacter vulpis]MBS4306250.1 methyltransferase [Campylobacter vulpis]MBS4329800.1 methyltransferase [Campylobacter vulpis]MBS4422986.1 methyltransferase [Campylobacter vulpis]PHY91736.1 methyltransferase [Campylobacter vulpis]
MQILKFFQFPNAYRYNSDSLLLSAFILEDNLSKKTLLDVGAGCGIIGILLKNYYHHLKLSLLDLQEENILLIKENLRQNALEAEFFHSDFKEFKSEKQFDYIVCNPPFYRQGTQKSTNLHKSISKNASFLPLEDLVKGVDSLLAPRGVFYFCYEALALSEICVILEKYKLKMTKIRFIHSKKGIKARLVLVKVIKNAKSPCEVASPLFVYENGCLSEEMRELGVKFRIESYDFERGL